MVHRGACKGKGQCLILACSVVGGEPLFPLFIGLSQGLPGIKGGGGQESQLVPPLILLLFGYKGADQTKC